MTFANPLKNSSPSVSFLSANSSSKLAPAQKALSPDDLRTMTRVSKSNPAEWIVFASFDRISPGRLFEAG